MPPINTHRNMFKLYPSLLKLTSTSDKTPDDQLKVAMDGIIRVHGSRFVADDSLSILKMYRVGIARATTNPVISSLQNNCTVLVEELETN
jgi:hypothetical protein